uniref:Uncharacterized protein n=1 Tax=Glossina pallidipes TaxID=7398 RepID=A0A1A9ZKC7_GLOPL
MQQVTFDERIMHILSHNAGRGTFSFSELYLLVPLALRPKILPGGLSIGLEEAEGAADNERWPSDIPLANDKLLLSSCFPVSSGKTCKSGVGKGRLDDDEDVAQTAAVVKDDKLPLAGKLLVLLMLLVMDAETVVILLVVVVFFKCKLYADVTSKTRGPPPSPWQASLPSSPPAQKLLAGKIKIFSVTALTLRMHSVSLTIGISASRIRSGIGPANSK